MQCRNYSLSLFTNREIESEVLTAIPSGFSIEGRLPQQFLAGIVCMSADCCVILCFR